MSTLTIYNSVRISAIFLRNIKQTKRQQCYCIAKEQLSTKLILYKTPLFSDAAQPLLQCSGQVLKVIM